MVMTQDTLDKTRSEFSYVFSRSAHHFSLPLLIRIHQACATTSLSLSLLPHPSFSYSEFFSKKKKKSTWFHFFPKHGSLLEKLDLKEISRAVPFILSEKRNLIDRDKGSRVLDSTNYT